MAILCRDWTTSAWRSGFSTFKRAAMLATESKAGRPCRSSSSLCTSSSALSCRRRASSGEAKGTSSRAAEKCSAARWNESEIATRNESALSWAPISPFRSQIGARKSNAACVRVRSTKVSSSASALALDMASAATPLSRRSRAPECPCHHVPSRNTRASRMSAAEAMTRPR